jgi:uncharacterized protein YjeT (DUF2065 family)
MAVVLALEGLAYALFPVAMQRFLASMATTPAERLRVFGLVAAIAGVAGAWALKAR